MGARGPVPTPTEVLKRRGSRRANHPDRRDEPQPAVEVPPCPSFLSPEAKREWKRQAEQLKAIRCIAKLDRAMLAVYCEAWADFVRATDAINVAWRAMRQQAAQAMDAMQDGGAAVDPALQATLTGMMVGDHPLAVFRDRAAARLIKIADRFGFSPSARARLKAVADEPEEEAGPTLYKIRS